MDLQLLNSFFLSSDTYEKRPSFAAVIEGNMVLVAVLAIWIILSIIGLYGIGTKIWGKKDAYKAIIPFYNFFKLFEAVELNPFLSIIVWIPIIGIVPLAVFHFFLAKAFGLNVTYQIISIIFPQIIYLMLGFDKKYEYQYIKGKNVAFADDFKTIMPEELTRDALTPAGAVNGAAVSGMTAKESDIARASAAAMEQNAKLYAEIAAKKKAEADKKAAEEAARKAAKLSDSDLNYDIFDEEKENYGPESVSLNFKVQTIGGKFQSTSAKPATTPVSKPAATAAPSTLVTKQPTSTTPQTNTTSAASSALSSTAPAVSAAAQAPQPSQQAAPTAPTSA